MPRKTSPHQFHRLNLLKHDPPPSSASGLWLLATFLPNIMQRREEAEAKRNQSGWKAR